ncbi:hypothetical protein TNCT_599721 [Trichonephila clavata]|uniref:Uncharacterized protein n=1 Tax=Trichonephila clavata TaxID=2740835 RepID=A0A8X6M2G7_TRICU|nr:hypothetical protein TNCT_599721 [Trichonephila clavata]
MASLLLGKRGGRSKSLLPRGGVGRRDVTSTWARVIKREGSTISKVVSGLSASRLTEYESNYLVAGCVSRKDIGITGDYSDEGSKDLKGRDDQAHCFCIGHAAFGCASSPENIPTPLAKRLVQSLPERPDTPLEMVDPSLLMTRAHVEVTSRLPTPPLRTQRDKSTQTYSPAWNLARDSWNDHPSCPIKDLPSNQRPLFNSPQLLFCLCPTQSSCVEIRYA